MEKRLDKVFRERSIGDEEFGELRPSAPLMEVVSGNLVRKGRALNLECGRGFDSLFLAQQGFAVAAMGFSPDDVAAVARKAEEARANIATYTIEGARLPFHEGEFDLVSDASGCLSGMSEGDRAALLPELHRTLRAGGRMFVLLPSYTAQKGGFTRNKIDSTFHPPFEVIRVVETSMTGAGGPRPPEHTYFYAVLLEKA